MPTTKDFGEEMTQPKMPSDDPRQEEELTARLMAALDGLGPGRALSLVVKHLAAEALAEGRELPVGNPDGRGILAYILPPKRRNALHAAARPRPACDAEVATGDLGDITARWRKNASEDDSNNANAGHADAHADVHARSGIN